MSDQVKLALVGCGGISGAHVNGYKDLYSRGCRDFVYTACCDVSEESAKRRASELAEIQGSTPVVFTRAEDLLNSGLAEAGDLCLPHFLHHSMAISLLEGGMHVMVEKPLGITIRASKKIIETAGKNKRILATAENIRRYAWARSGKWAATQQKLAGDVVAVDIANMAYGPFDASNPAMKWRMVKLLVGGGMIMDSGAHFTDMMLCLFGEPEEIYCNMSTMDTRMIQGLPVLGAAQADVEDTWHAVIKFAQGPLVTWSYSRALPGPVLRHGRYYGTKGLIEDNSFPFHCFQSGCTVHLGDNTYLTREEVLNAYKNSLSEAERKRLFPYGCEDGFGIQLWDFADAIRNSRKPELDGTAGLKAKALCEACYESAYAGEPVKYADVLSGKIHAYQQPIDEYWKL